MKDGYKFSGGPWILRKAGWVKTDNITLVPEPEVLGHQAEARQGDLQDPGRHVC